MIADLGAQAFLCLRKHFFDQRGAPKSFSLRAKGGTQSDPFDELLAKLFEKELSAVSVVKAGPNTSPDLALYRRDECARTPRASLRTDSTRILAIEVKKLDRTPTGLVARATGMDFNTTPPCGTVRIYDEKNQPLDVRAFYLFVCQESAGGKSEQCKLTALALCDGDALNADFEFYLQTIQPRDKHTRLGTYADGAIRPRPMVIFPNPLGNPNLDKRITLIHGSADLRTPDLRIVAEIRRRDSMGASHSFWCYRSTRDPSTPKVEVLEDPFPRTKRPTKGVRGKLRVDFTPI